VVFLVDGYNLMHATGLAHRRLPPGQLQAARKRFLDWLADSPPIRNGSVEVRVVFDAQNGPTESREHHHRRVSVRFAFRQTADDLIETLILAEPRQARLVVVSNDGRLHESARRRGFRGWSCQAFTDWLIGGESPRANPPEPPPDEKPPLSSADDDEFLRAFQTPKPWKPR
jgi:hypothetical protein